MTMPEEEKMILHWIMQYEVMTMEQAIQLLHHKNRSTAQKVIRGLKKQHKISYVNGGVYIGAYPCSKPDPKVIDAIWILIQYADVIEHYQHHPASYPSQIYFLKDGCGYEIVVLNEGEQYLTRLLQADEGLKYILVIPNENMIPYIELPDAPCMFAVIQSVPGAAPEVTFYTKGA